MQENNNNKIAYSLNKIAFIYWELNNKDSSVFYFLEGIKYNEKINNRNGIKAAYNNISMIYADNNQLNLAISYAKKSLKVRRKIGEKLEIATGLIGIASFLENQGKNSESNKYLDEALEIASELNNYQLLRNCYGIYTTNYKALGEVEKSQESFNKFSIYSKQIQEDNFAKRETENKKKLNSTLSKADSLVKAKQDELLLQENLLSSSEEKNKEKEAEILNLNKDKKLKDAILKEKEAQIEKSAIIRNFIIVGFVFGLFFVSLILLNMRKLKKAKNVLALRNTAIAARNKEIKQQKDNVEKKSKELEGALVQIEKQNNHITNSINYAQRIQKAMLRSESALQTYLPDSFILLKPRDKVSGDFFWFKEIGSMAQTTRALLEALGEKPDENDLKNKKLILAAIDCTGHGVPGAFMSLIGFNLLNEITNMGFSKNAGNILNQLHKSVRSALKQEVSDNRDGMDVALCVIDQENKMLNFAGAKNPLVYIRDGKLNVIKGDKSPIGGFQREKKREFTHHDIPLDKPTSFYIFSDGFVDQFGGEKGRKFMKKNFYKLLLEIHEKPMTEQKKILHEAYKNWMGEENSQIDDMLVIGFKI